MGKLKLTCCGMMRRRVNFSASSRLWVGSGDEPTQCTISYYLHLA
jgi:hypothetical protein